MCQALFYMLEVQKWRGKKPCHRGVYRQANGVNKQTSSAGAVTNIKLSKQ